jgi:hypothetical protein
MNEIVTYATEHYCVTVNDSEANNLSDPMVAVRIYKGISATGNKIDFDWIEPPNALEKLFGLTYETKVFKAIIKYKKRADKLEKQFLERSRVEKLNIPKEDCHRCQHKGISHVPNCIIKDCSCKQWVKNNLDWMTKEKE